jgi:hypothetical protein
LEDLISLIERNNLLLNLTTISNENFVIVNYTTFYTGVYDDDELSKNSEIPDLPKLKGWKFEEFSSKGFKMRLSFFNPLLVSQSYLRKDIVAFTFLRPELF